MARRFATSSSIRTALRFAAVLAAPLLIMHAVYAVVCDQQCKECDFWYHHCNDPFQDGKCYQFGRQESGNWVPSAVCHTNGWVATGAGAMECKPDGDKKVIWHRWAGCAAACTGCNSGAGDNWVEQTAGEFDNAIGSQSDALGCVNTPSPPQ